MWMVHPARKNSSLMSKCWPSSPTQLTMATTASLAGPPTTARENVRASEDAVVEPRAAADTCNSSAGCIGFLLGTKDSQGCTETRGEDGKIGASQGLPLQASKLTD